MEETGLTLWLTGLPASGKTTIARAVVRRLVKRGLDVEILDADALRSILTPRPRYTEEERDWFYDVLVFLAELLSRHGVTVLVAATAHRRAYRDSARLRLTRFEEVYMRCPLGVCRERDPKGLYQRAARGEITSLPGEQIPYEPPDSPFMVLDTDRLDPEDAAELLVAKLVEQELV